MKKILLQLGLATVGLVLFQFVWLIYYPIDKISCAFGILSLGLSQCIFNKVEKYFDNLS